jgi:hypothetical protein
MKITIKRISVNSNSITGELYINDEFLGYTLEHLYRNNEKEVSSFPAGQYEAFERTDKGNKEKHHDRYRGDWRIELKNVEGREAIQIHIGNTPKNTNGCVLIGEYVDPKQNLIGGSANAYKSFETKVKNSLNPGEKIVVAVEDNTSYQPSFKTQQGKSKMPPKTTKMPDISSMSEDEFKAYINTHPDLPPKTKSDLAKLFQQIKFKNTGSKQFLSEGEDVLADLLGDITIKLGNIADITNSQEKARKVEEISKAAYSGVSIVSSILELAGANEAAGLVSCIGTGLVSGGAALAQAPLNPLAWLTVGASFLSVLNCFSAGNQESPFKKLFEQYQKLAAQIVDLQHQVQRVSKDLKGMHAETLSHLLYFARQIHSTQMQISHLHDWFKDATRYLANLIIENQSYQFVQARDKAKIFLDFHGSVNDFLFDYIYGLTAYAKEKLIKKGFKKNEHNKETLLKLLEGPEQAIDMFTEMTKIPYDGVKPSQWITCASAVAEIFTLLYKCRGDLVAGFSKKEKLTPNNQYLLLGDLIQEGRTFLNWIEQIKNQPELKTRLFTDYQTSLVEVVEKLRNEQKEFEKKTLLQPLVDRLIKEKAFLENTHVRNPILLELRAQFSSHNHTVEDPFLIHRSKTVGLIDKILEKLPTIFIDVFDNPVNMTKRVNKEFSSQVICKAVEKQPVPTEDESSYCFSRASIDSYFKLFSNDSLAFSRFIVEQAPVIPDVELADGYGLLEINSSKLLHTLSKENKSSEENQYYWVRANPYEELPHEFRIAELLNLGVLRTLYQTESEPFAIQTVFIPKDEHGRQYAFQLAHSSWDLVNDSEGYSYLKESGFCPHHYMRITYCQTTRSHCFHLIIYSLGYQYSQSMFSIYDIKPIHNATLILTNKFSFIDTRDSLPDETKMFLTELREKKIPERVNELRRAVIDKMLIVVQKDDPSFAIPAKLLEAYFHYFVNPKIKESLTLWNQDSIVNDLKQCFKTACEDIVYRKIEKSLLEAQKKLGPSFTPLFSEHANEIEILTHKQETEPDISELDTSSIKTEQSDIQWLSEGTRQIEFTLARLIAVQQLVLDTHQLQTEIEVTDNNSYLQWLLTTASVSFWVIHQIYLYINRIGLPVANAMDILPDATLDSENSMVVDNAFYLREPLIEFRNNLPDLTAKTAVNITHPIADKFLQDDDEIFYDAWETTDTEFASTFYNDNQQMILCSTNAINCQPTKNSEVTNPLLHYSWSLEKASRKLPFDWGAWDKYPYRHADTKKPVFVFRVFKKGQKQEVGSMHFYGRPSVCRSESGDRHNVEFHGVLIGTSVDTKMVNPVCTILPPTLQDKIINSSAHAAKHGLVRGASTFVGYALEKNGYSANAAYYAQQTVYYGAIFAMRFCEQVTPTSEFMAAATNAAVATGYLFLANKAIQIVTDWGSAKAKEYSWLWTAKVINHFGNLAIFVYDTVSHGKEKIPERVAIGTASLAAGLTAQKIVETTGKVVVDSVTSFLNSHRATLEKRDVHQRHAMQRGVIHEVTQDISSPSMRLNH